MTGSKAYKNKAAIAGKAPIPNKGIRNPSSAIEGMVCKMPAKPKTGAANRCLRAMITPKGRPMKTAISTAVKVRPVWVMVCCQSLPDCCSMNCQRLCCCSISLVVFVFESRFLNIRKSHVWLTGFLHQMHTRQYRGLLLLPWHAIKFGHWIKLHSCGFLLPADHSRFFLNRPIAIPAGNGVG